MPCKSRKSESLFLLFDLRDSVGRLVCLHIIKKQAGIFLVTQC